MEVKIKELPLVIQQLVIANQIKQGNTPNTELDLVDSVNGGNFNWNISLEGREFWEDLNDGKDVIHYACYPKEILNNYSIF